MALLRAPGKGKRLGGRNPRLTPSLTTQGEDGELERPVFADEGARVSEAPHIPLKSTVGVRPLPAAPSELERPDSVQRKSKVRLYFIIWVLSLSHGLNLDPLRAA